jgi:hypothetical protein
MITGFEPDPNIKAEPILLRSRGGGNIQMPRRDGGRAGRDTLAQAIRFPILCCVQPHE